MGLKRLLFLTASLGAGWLVYQAASMLDPPMRAALAIFVVAVILWVTEGIPLFLTSFVILLLEVLLLSRPGAAHSFSSVIFFAPFFNPIITLFMGGFALSFAMRKYGLDQRLARFILMHSRNDYNRLLSLLLGISAFCSMWLSNTATTVLLLAVILPVIKHARQKQHAAPLLLAISFGATIGGMATPVGTPPNAIAMNALLAEHAEVSFLSWLLASAPVCILLLCFLKGVLSFFYNVDAKQRLNLPKLEIEAWTLPSIGTACIFILTVCLWLTASFHRIDEGVVALVPIILLFATRLLKPSDIKELGWETLLLVGGGLSLGVAMQVTGLASHAVELITQGPLAPTVYVLAFAGFTLLLSTFISNTVATSLSVPFVILLSNELTSAVMIVALASSVALALPISSPSNAIVYSSGYVRARDFMKVGAVISFIGILALFLLSKLYWPYVLP